MNETELVEWVRDEATLSARSTNYPKSKIVQMMRFNMQQVFSPLIANARCGYWFHTFTRTLGQNNRYVRLPARSCPSIEQCDISADDGRFYEPLTEALESEMQDWERDSYREQTPQAFVLRGTTIFLSNPSLIDTCKLRVKTVVRPSLLVEEQTAGLVTDVDYDARVITVNSMPVNRLTSTTISGVQTLDCIDAQGSFERTLLDAQGTVLNGTTIQIANGYDLVRVQPGDYVRVANQSDWPQLPEEFHALLGSITAIPICRQQDLNARADTLSSTCSDALQRLKSHIVARVRVDTHKPIQHGW